MDILLLGVLDQSVALWEEGVTLDLVDDWQHTSCLANGVDVFGREIGNADRTDLALRQLGHGCR